VPEGSRARAVPLGGAPGSRDFEVRQIKVQLSPPRLGPVLIEVQAESNHVSASLLVSRPETAQALRGAEGQVRDLLRDQGLAMGAFDVSCQQQGGFAGNGGRWPTGTVAPLWTGLPVAASKVEARLPRLMPVGYSGATAIDVYA
jgi:hypothetical protein